MHGDRLALLPRELPTSLLRAVVLARAGRTTAALAAVDALREAGEVAADPTARALLLATAVDCRLARGDLGEAMALGDELTAHLHPAEPGAVAAGDPRAAALAEHAHGELAAALQEPERALQHFTRAGRLLAGAGADTGLVHWRTGAAMAAVRLGHRAEAARLAREQLELVTPGGSPYAIALALRTLAATSAGHDSLSLLRRARATLAGRPVGRLAAQVDTDLAGLLLLTGPGSGSTAAEEALLLLRGAEEYAAREELWPLQGRVRRLLERLGAGARPTHAELLALLTGTEQRVARLAAEGLTNREIGQRLDVGVKAVEWHLSRVYRKLGISSRTRLAAALGVPSRPPPRL